MTVPAGTNSIRGAGRAPPRACGQPPPEPGEPPREIGAGLRHWFAAPGSPPRRGRSVVHETDRPVRLRLAGGSRMRRGHRGTTAPEPRDEIPEPPARAHGSPRADRCDPDGRDAVRAGRGRRADRTARGDARTGNSVPRCRSRRTPAAARLPDRRTTLRRGRVAPGSALHE